MSGGGGDSEDVLKVRFAMSSPIHTSGSPCSSHQAVNNSDSELLDPLANEAERKSMEHYDIYYHNERSKHSRGKLTFAIRYDYIH
ncbi:unnamed protein product, partial [Soboliphyme baturini]|uniref:FERM domain-containing protein n=1 Tax=Soboliphyme baturini TaxID=241478 RepID=A0A183IYY9_9BILA